MELLISNEILQKNLPLPPINDTYLSIMFPEPEVKIKTNQLPPADEPTYIVPSPPLLANYSPPSIVTTPPLLNHNESDLNSTIFHHRLMIYLRSSTHIHQFHCLQNQLQQ